MASTLEGYVLRDKISSVVLGKTDERGELISEGLAHGLYLILGRQHTQDNTTYTTEPFMVMLPTAHETENIWLYDVEVNPKHESYTEPSEDTISRKVLKVWKDEGYQNVRPQEIIVQLLCDGWVHETVTLNAANNWRHRWDGLDSECHWTIVEKETDGYMVGVTLEGTTFVVTNTYDGYDIPENLNEPDVTLPQTGQLWWPVPVLLVSGLFLIILGRLRRRNVKITENEEK